MHDHETHSLVNILHGFSIEGPEGVNRELGFARFWC